MRNTMPLLLSVLLLVLGCCLAPGAVRAEVDPGVPAAVIPPITPTPAAPATPVAPPDLRPPANIAPVASADGSGALHFEGMWIIAGTRQFYLAFGRWPASWREVVESGLFQARLTAGDGHEVDPDSTAPPLVGEVRYLPAADGTGAKLEANLDAAQELQRVELEAPLGYADLFRAMYLLEQDPARAKLLQEYFDKVAADPQRLLQFALAGMLEQGLGLYKLLHGDYPPDWDTFLASGCSPVGTASTNPATGETLVCDGSAWGYSYRFYPAEKDQPNGKYYFCHVDADGSSPEFPVLY